MNTHVKPPEDGQRTKPNFQSLAEAWEMISFAYSTRIRFPGSWSEIFIADGDAAGFRGLAGQTGIMVMDILPQVTGTAFSPKHLCALSY